MTNTFSFNSKIAREATVGSMARKALGEILKNRGGELHVSYRDGVLSISGVNVVAQEDAPVSESAPLSVQEPAEEVRIVNGHPV